MKSLKGLIMAILSSATFGLIPLFSIPLMENTNKELEIDLDSVCFYRFLFSALLMGLIVLVNSLKKKDTTLKRALVASFGLTAKQFFFLFLISIFYASTSIFLTASYTIGEIPSGIATTIHFLSCVCNCNYDYVFWGETLFTKDIGCIACLWRCFLLKWWLAGQRIGA
ncbi:MAG: EamA family transporter [Bacteroidia bacterium]|nr:EamA family transporter [Bacteroidia bacterium]